MEREREREGENEGERNTREKRERRHAHAIVPVVDSTSRRRAARAGNLLPPLRTKLQSR